MSMGMVIFRKWPITSLMFKLGRPNLVRGVPFPQVWPTSIGYGPLPVFMRPSKKLSMGTSHTRFGPLSININKVADHFWVKMCPSRTGPKGTPYTKFGHLALISKTLRTISVFMGPTKKAPLGTPHYKFWPPNLKIDRAMGHLRFYRHIERSHMGNPQPKFADAEALRKTYTRRIFQNGGVLVVYI